MELAEILHQVSPCDTQKPYIFVSYSSQDKDYVWPDVLEYQHMGYNVWLDEKNLDKTKASWKEDALTAIEDMYCMLVVFYVSKSSLLSDACYRELAKTTDEFTTALHFGPVKFIAIDVDEIGDITEFTRDLHQSVFLDTTLSKDAKSKMLITLHQFMKDFFGSNNEKVRIHPKNERNRKMNYYEEIVAAFPDAARNCARKAKKAEAQDNAAEQKYKQVAQQLSKEAEARKKAEEEARLLKEKMAKLEAAAKTTTQIPHHYAAAAASREPNNHPKEATANEKVNAAIARVNTKNLSATGRIMSASECGETKITNAIRAYAKDINPEDVIGLMDMTFFGSAKEGCIITKDAVYSDEFKGRCIEFNKVASYAIGDRRYYVDITYKDGTKQRFFITTVQQKVILPFLDEIIAGG